MSGPDRVRVGLVGLSAERGWAAAAHLPALRAVPGFDVVALAASTPASAEAAGRAHGVDRVFSDPRALAASPEVDLVVVTVKVPEHRRLVAAAVDAGKAVLCEWPLGNGLAEAEDMASSAAAAGVRAFVGLQARAAPAVRFVRDLVASGELGEVLSTTVVGSGDRWGPTTDAHGTYLLDRAHGATMLTIPVGHTLDGICFCLGELTEVSATTATRRPRVQRTDSDASVPMDAEDQIAVTGRLEGGAVLSLHYRGGRTALQGFRWEIEGTEGTAVVTGASGHLQYGRVTVAVGAAGAKELVERVVPASYEADGLRGALAPSSLPYTVAHAYDRLRTSLRDGSGDAPTFEDGVRRHRVLAAVETAARTGQRQRLAEPGPTGGERVT